MQDRTTGRMDHAAEASTNPQRGAAVIRDIHPRTPCTSLTRSLRAGSSKKRFPVDLVAALCGMSVSFVKRALGGDSDLSLDQVYALLDLDAYAETFIPRSKIANYLLTMEDVRPEEPLHLPSRHMLV